MTIDKPSSGAPVTAVIVTVGSELASGRVVDGNKAYLGRELRRLGVDVPLMLSVPDRHDEIAAVVKESVGRGPGLVIVSGGLGPTEDDMTARAVAAALGLEMELDEAVLERVLAARGGGGAGPHERKQATLPAGSRTLTPVGTAPGFIIEARGVTVVALPGVPYELAAMWEEAKDAAPVARVLATANPPEHLALSFYGTGEPAIDEEVAAAVGGRPEIEAGICSRFGEAELHLFFPPAERERVDSLLGRLRERFGDSIYSEGEPVEVAVVRELAARGRTLAVAESCTGGLLSGAITSVSGASEVFRGGVVAYHNDIKVGLLDVRREIIDNAGAVSEPVAQWMATGARKGLDADYGIGITGIAGPAGGTPEKPVGLVYTCVSSGEGDIVRRHQFPGGREDVRGAAVVTALHVLLELVTGCGGH